MIDAIIKKGAIEAQHDNLGGWLFEAKSESDVVEWVALREQIREVESDFVNYMRSQPYSPDPLQSLVNRIAEVTGAEVVFLREPIQLPDTATP